MLNLKCNEDTSFTFASRSLNFAFMDCIFELKNCIVSRGMQYNFEASPERS